jgi:hypothetical protein
MFPKTLTALLLTIAIAGPAAADETADLYKAEIAKVRAQALSLVDKHLERMSVEFDRNFDAYAKRAVEHSLPRTAANDDAVDDNADDVADAPAASKATDCNSAADGKPGASNGSDKSAEAGNGGKGGTVIVEGSAKAGDCYSANGGDGGSNWIVRGNNKSVGNGGDGGKILSK